MKPFKYNLNNNSGQFRHRITFLQADTDNTFKDELDQEEAGLVEIKKAWSMIKTLKGSEYMSAGAERESANFRFIIPYTTGVTSDMQILYKGRYFDIVEPPINDDEMNQTLTIIAKERG
jgi:SPP1 family predicted phage head-tail adaptor